MIQGMIIELSAVNTIYGLALFKHVNKYDVRSAMHDDDDDNCVDTCRCLGVRG